MENKELLSKVDHTNLNPCATWEEIKATVDEGIALGCASVCIMPYYVKRAVEYANGRIPIGAAVGFPRGDYTTKSKVFEAEQAIEDGALEVDMVVNLCEVKSGNYEKVLEDIKQVRRVCPGILKVIVETSELTEDEKVRLCDVVAKSGAEFIKTSTGFSKSGAVIEDVKLFRKCLPDGVKIKASGGITTRKAAEEFVRAGADRIGTKFTREFIK